MKNLALAVLILPTAIAYGLQLPFPQDTIAYNNRFNNRQSVAFDSGGSLHVAYSGQIGTMSATREIYYVTDSAGTLVTTQVTVNAVDDNYPTIVVDRNNAPHICFLGRDAGNLFQVQYTRLENGAFIPPVFITQGGLNKATPYCAITPDSILHFVYFTFATGTNHAYYRSFNLRDSTLSPEMQLTQAEVTGDFDQAIAVDTAGCIHIVVKSGSTLGGPLKYYTNRSGTLLETPTGISVAVDYPRVAVDQRNTVHILYRDSPTEVLYVVNDASGTFGTPVAITPVGQRPAGYHNVAIDDENRLYVVYQSSVTTSGRGWYLVNGRNGIFSDTLRVDNLAPLTRNTSAVAARGDGEIAVTYAPGSSRDGSVVCDIFLKRGVLKTTGVDDRLMRPTAFHLFQNYPNPFNPSTTISYQLPEVSVVSLRVYDILGREVATLVNEVNAPGYHEVTWDASGVASGVYVCRISSDAFSQTRKMLLMK